MQFAPAEIWDILLEAKTIKCLPQGQSLGKNDPGTF